MTCLLYHQCRRVKGRHSFFNLKLSFEKFFTFRIVTVCPGRRYTSDVEWSRSVWSGGGRGGGLPYFGIAHTLNMHPHWCTIKGDILYHQV